jgi:hypothetical protein
MSVADPRELPVPEIKHPKIRLVAEIGEFD